MVPTLMVLTPLVNNDPLLVTHGIAAFHSGVKVIVKVASLIATDGSVLVVASPLATNLLLDRCLDFVRHRNSVQAKRELAKKDRRRSKALRRRSCGCTGGALAPTLKLRADARLLFQNGERQVRMATVLVDVRREARSASGRLHSMLSSPPQAERSYSAANSCELRDAQ